MAGIEAEGYTKVVHKLYNKAFHEFEDERISNANVRFSEIHTCTAEEAGAYGFTFTKITKPADEQLRLIYLNFWSNDPDNSAVLIIDQAGGTSRLLPQGQVDAIIVSPLGGDGNPYVKLATLKDPIHVLEGEITFRVIGATAGRDYGLSLWGDENKPQIDP